MAFTKVAPAGIGSTPGDGYRIGDSFLHSTGVEITNINATGIVTAASLDISGAIDFDGHTELDNVNISGVSTFASNIDANGDLDVDGHTELDNLNVSGIGTFNGIKLIDNKSILFGTSDDMRIRHTGSHSQITDEGTGSLRLGGHQVVIGNAVFSETSATFTQGASVALYYGNSKKIETTTNGATFTSSRVQFHNSTSSGSYIQLSNSGTGHASDSGFWLGANSSNQGVVLNKENTDILFYTNNTERLRINAGGNITTPGITTSNTGFMFGTDGEMYLYKSAANTATLRITSDGPYAEFKDNSGDVQMGSASGTLRLSAGGNEKLRISSTGDTTVTGKIIAYDASSTSNQVRARIKATASNDDGRVGVYYGNTEIAALFGKWSGSAFSTGLNIPYEPFVVTGAGGAERLRINTSGSLIVGASSYGAAGSFSVGANGTFRSILASGTAQDTLIAGISGVSNGFQITTDTSNNQTYKFHSGTSQAVTIKDNKLGVLIGSPFNRFQCGGHTFTGGDAMYSNDRVGMSNHGSLTGLMLASTYNDATHPEYGLVFVQGPTTSSYNVWSVSPDGPAKGDSLNFHYGGYSGSGGRPNIHAPAYKKFEMNGDGNFHITAGNLKFANGYGVDFSATGNSGGTMTSELLHDYEEGTFTPTIIRSSAGYSGNYNYQHGVYTRVGRLVHCYIDVDINNFSGGGGHVGMSGLPYTVSSHGLPGWPHSMHMARMYLDGDYAAGVDARTIRFSGTNYGYVMNIDDDSWDYGNYTRVIFTGSFTFMVS